MVLSVKILNNLTITIPIQRILDHKLNQVLLCPDTNSASLIKPGQEFSLISKTGKGIRHIKNGAIQSVLDDSRGLIVTI
jgi:hypothetical protein